MVIARYVAIAAVLWAGLSIAQEAPPPLPTTLEIKGQVDAGQYRDALKGLLRVLQLKGPAAEPFNRLEMLMLRAECQIQIKETKSALDTLETLQKEAVTAGKGDDMGAALAMTLLIQRSPALKYIPKSSTGPIAKQPIDILDRKVRPDAYKALYEDELASTRQKVHVAENARTIQPIVEGARAAATLRAIEKAATGETTQSQQLAKDLGEHAASLLTSSVMDLTSKTNTVERLANTVVSVPIARYDQTTGRSWLDQYTRRRGLEDKDIRDLKATQQTCTQIIGTAHDLALALGQSVPAFHEAASEAERTRTKAGELLNDTYGEIPKPNKLGIN